MGARQRLNSLYFTGILIVAAICGAAVESWRIFVLVIIALTAISVHGGNIRANRIRSRHRFCRR